MAASTRRRPLAGASNSARLRGTALPVRRRRPRARRGSRRAAARPRCRRAARIAKRRWPSSSRCSAASRAPRRSSTPDVGVPGEARLVDDHERHAALARGGHVGMVGRHRAQAEGTRRPRPARRSRVGTTSMASPASSVARAMPWSRITGGRVVERGREAVGEQQPDRVAAAGAQPARGRVGACVAEPARGARGSGRAAPGRAGRAGCRRWRPWCARPRPSSAIVFSVTRFPTRPFYLHQGRLAPAPRSRRGTARSP